MKTVTTGDVYSVGNHVVGCGDSLNAGFVAKVIGNHKIQAVVTDPPYGVAYVENKVGVAKLGKKDAKVIKGDHIQTEYEYARFTQSWVEAVLPHLDSYNTFHIFNCDSMFLALRTGMYTAGLHFSQMLIWIKNQSVMGRMDYLPQQELIAYGWYKKHKRIKAQMSSAIFHPRPQKSKLHPTQKPIGLLRRLILNVTSINDYVYDGFLGSGSTALACEQLGRTCIGIEQDAEYVEVCLKRLEKLTKKERVLIISHEATS
jgi:DNA modification methylase